MIDERRASPEARADSTYPASSGARLGRGRGEAMSDQQLRDEANTLFVAGHETTANALVWAFYLLARNPDARARVQAEADAFGPEGPTTFAPEALDYTTRVFKEALRLIPRFTPATQPGARRDPRPDLPCGHDRTREPVRRPS